MIKKVPYQASVGPTIILVRPQMAENIGMVARAMMNCTLSELRLVHPRESATCAKAVAASSGAQEILEKARVYATLEEAVADMQFILATTARPRDMTKPVYHPEKAIGLCADHIRNGEKTAILFGAERTGLENEELIFADGIIEIPLNPRHCSLNLSQAVLLTGYTWFRQTLDHDNTRMAMGGSKPATKIELQAFFAHLESALEARGYFRLSDKRERMQRNLRNIFARAALTGAELKTLHGVVDDLTRLPKKIKP